MDPRWQRRPSYHRLQRTPFSEIRYGDHFRGHALKAGFGGRSRFRECDGFSRVVDGDGLAVELTGPWAAEQDAYVVSLATAPLSAQTRRTYASKARQYRPGWRPLRPTATRSVPSPAGIGPCARLPQPSPGCAQASASDRQQRPGRRRRLLHPARPRAGPGSSRRPARRRAPGPGAPGPGPLPARRGRLPVAPGPSRRPRPLLRRRPHQRTRRPRRRRTSGSRLARARCGSSARANGSARSRSTRSWRRP